MGVRTLRSPWAVVLAQAAIVAVIASSCGRETIELSSSGQEGGAPVPDAGSCAPSSCEALGGVCVLETGKCGECDSDDDCPDLLFPVCNTLTHQCVMCRTTDDCEQARLATPFPQLIPELSCDTALQRCVLACSPTAPCRVGTCDLESGTCIECQDECSAILNLECLDGRCVECRDDDDCPGRVCHRGTHTCVDCFDSSHCGSGGKCNLIFHNCVP